MEFLFNSRFNYQFKSLKILQLHLFVIIAKPQSNNLQRYTQKHNFTKKVTKEQGALKPSPYEFRRVMIQHDQFTAIFSHEHGNFLANRLLFLFVFG